MAYNKWQLGLADVYQRTFATRRIAEMLRAEVDDTDGPVALVSEAANAPDWDDVVAFGTSDLGLTATHYQLKRSYKGVMENPEETFKKLFRRAAELRDADAPYGADRPVDPHRRFFVLVFPTEHWRPMDATVADLRTLLDGVEAGNYAAASLCTTSASSRPAPQQRWLELMAEAIPVEGSRQRLLEQLRVQIESHESLAEQGEKDLAHLVSNGASASQTIISILSSSPPEAALDSAFILRHLHGAGHHLRSEHAFARVGAATLDRCAILVPPRLPADTPKLLAADAVGTVWNSHNARSLSLLVNPSLNRNLRVALLRLALHSHRTPVATVDASGWTIRAEGAVRGNLGSGGVPVSRFVEPTRRSRIPAVDGHTPDILAAALHLAMDRHLSALVVQQLDSLGMDIGATAAHITRATKLLDDLPAGASRFHRLVREWWHGRKGAEECVRAGPSTAEPIAAIALALSLIEDAGFVLKPPEDDDDDAVASIGDFPVRATALSHASRESDDGVRYAQAIHFEPQVLAGHPGLVILSDTKPDRVYRGARTLTAVRSPPNLTKALPATVVLSAREVREAYEKEPPRMNAWVQEQCAARNLDLQAALEDALAVSREEPDAA